MLRSSKIGNFLKKLDFPENKFDYFGVHPTTTDSLLYDFWESFRGTWSFLRDAPALGLEPMEEPTMDRLEKEIAKQRVWLGAIAPSDEVLMDQFWAHRAII